MDAITFLTAIFSNAEKPINHTTIKKTEALIKVVKMSRNNPISRIAAGKIAIDAVIISIVTHLRTTSLKKTGIERPLNWLANFNIIPEEKTVYIMKTIYKVDGGNPKLKSIKQIIKGKKLRIDI